MSRERWHRKGTPHSSKTQHYLSLIWDCFVMMGEVLHIQSEFPTGPANFTVCSCVCVLWSFPLALILRGDIQDFTYDYFRCLTLIKDNSSETMKIKYWFCFCRMFFKHQMYRYHHHHPIALVARISRTLSRHSSLSFIALGRSSGQHPVSSHSCWMYVRAGRPAFGRPCVGIHKSSSLISSSLLL